MYEVEVKVPADIEAVADRLDELDAGQVDTVIQEDTYYDAPHRDFAETDEAFRVRRETRKGETTTKVTYKGPLLEAESKSREEFETGVEDGDDIDAIVQHLGFEPVATVRKNRRVYEVRRYHVTLDAVDDVGEFVEVERETDGEIESIRDGAYEVLRDLDLDPNDQQRTSYLGLLLDDAGE
ncbi:class IV adenylate cyclase [Haloarcula sp. S1AR25-5A]|uniref:Class IV adenylate cyclase n=1 Tax=Haloarcula terrestris TaxID=2950533 RepID=A0AAE4JHS1_9EURY|nr:class IV adenylate cyclase [Haloarcula terrestris]MDS0222993.1 class IV adenylate cyclase [Haloarcula terrestris]